MSAGAARSATLRDNGLYDDKHGVHVFGRGVLFWDANKDGEESNATGIVSLRVNPEALERLPKLCKQVWTTGVAFDELVELSSLGRGAFGEVHKVRHTVTNRLMAVKRIGVTSNVRQRHMIARELRNLYHTHSDNIIKFYGAFFDQGMLPVKPTARARACVCVCVCVCACACACVCRIPWVGEIRARARFTLD